MSSSVISKMTGRQKWLANGLSFTSRGLYHACAQSILPSYTVLYKTLVYRSGVWRVGTDVCTVTDDVGRCPTAFCDDNRISDRRL